MSRREKQRESLLLLELDFSSSLNVATVAAIGNKHSQFFLAEEYNPWRELEGRTDETTNRLVAQANQIIKMRHNVGETQDCLASIFLSYCEAYCDISNANRGGVQMHAMSLHEELYANTRARSE